MKKLLLSSIVALAALGTSAAPSQAWTFGLIPHHCWPCGFGFGCGKCGGCCDTICIRPYNAFSPTACGSMTFTGCNPFCGAGCPGGGPAGYPGGGPAGYPGYSPEGMTLPACDGCPTEDAVPTDPGVPSMPAASQPAAVPGAGAQAKPYGGAIQAAAAYGYPSMLPASVMPNGGQPYYYGGYGR